MNYKITEEQRERLRKEEYLMDLMPYYIIGGGVFAVVVKMTLSW